jgi:hypothetical protein
MPKSSQKGFAHILILILIVAGIALGIYLVQHPTIFNPHASVSGPIAPKTGFTLTSLESVPPGGEFYAKVIVNSDFDAANLFTLVLNYPVDKVEFVGVSPAVDEDPSPGGTFIKKWIEQSDDTNGTVTLSGAVPNPGFKTTVGNPASMAVVRFKVKPDLGGLPKGEIPLIVSNESGIYRNSDNENIISSNTGVTLNIIHAGVSPSPSPSAVSKYIKVLSPNGGESLKVGENVSLSWEGSGNTGYTIYFLDLDDPNYPNYVAVISDPNQKTYTWSAHKFNPNTPGRYKLKVTSKYGEANSVSDESDNYFTVSFAPSPSPSASPAPVLVDGKRADLYKDPKKPNFVNDQDISVFFTKCAADGLELFGKPSSVQPICDIFQDDKITVQDWAVLIKFRNKSI